MSKPYDLIAPGADRQATERALAEAFAAKSGCDPAVKLPAAQDRLAPAFAAADLGHTLAWDAPAGLTSVRSRWTCRECGSAVLVREERMYGSALDGQCPGHPADVTIKER
jgi:hypothetical protein